MKVINKQRNAKLCVVCGLENDLGIKASFYDLEDGSCGCLFSFKKIHQSYPGRTHGGMITAVLDEVMGRALWTTEPEVFGCTTTMNVTLRKAVPYGVPLKARGVIVSNSKMFFSAKGYIYDTENNLLAEANAKYVKLSDKKISGSDVKLEDEMKYKIIDDVKSIDFPETR